MFSQMKLQDCMEFWGRQPCACEVGVAGGQGPTAVSSSGRCAHGPRVSPQPAVCPGIVRVEETMQMVFPFQRVRKKL